MKKVIMMAFCVIVTMILMIGCNSNDDYVQDFDVENIALKEAIKITSEQGYTLKSEDLTERDIVLGDSGVFDFIKDASVKGGYLKSDFKSMSEYRRIVGYELVEKSKKNESVMLCMVIDKGKVIGAYLDYAGYSDGITSIDFKENFK